MGDAARGGAAGGGEPAKAHAEASGLAAHLSQPGPRAKVVTHEVTRAAREREDSRAVRSERQGQADPVGSVEPDPEGAFFLACSTAAGAVGWDDRITAWRRLKLLVQLDVLEVVEPHTAKRATRYRWRAGTTA